MAAVTGVASGEYFFTCPYFQWVNDPNIIVAMVVFVVVAMTVSVLADTTARRTAEAAAPVPRPPSLAHLASAVLTSRDPLPRLMHDLRATFTLDAVRSCAATPATGRRARRRQPGAAPARGCHRCPRDRAGTLLAVPSVASSAGGQAVCTPLRVTADGTSRVRTQRRPCSIPPSDAARVRAMSRTLGTPARRPPAHTRAQPVAAG